MLRWIYGKTRNSETRNKYIKEVVEVPWIKNGVSIEMAYVATRIWDQLRLVEN